MAAENSHAEIKNYYLKAQSNKENSKSLIHKS